MQEPDPDPNAAPEPPVHTPEHEAGLNGIADTLILAENHLTTIPATANDYLELYIRKLTNKLQRTFDNLAPGSDITAARRLADVLGTPELVAELEVVRGARWWCVRSL